MMHENRSDFSASYLDIAKLEKQFAGKPKLLAVMKQEFAGLQSSLLPEMQGAYGDGKLAVLKDLAHTLKGNAALIGAFQVQELSRMIEKAIQEEDREGLAANMERLPVTMQETLEYLNGVTVD